MKPKKEELEHTFILNNGLEVTVRQQNNTLVFDVNKVCIISLTGGPLSNTDQFPDALQVSFK